MHFKPKTYIDLCMAMRTMAVVNVEGVVGVIQGIEIADGDSRSIVVKIKDSINGDVVARRFVD